MRPVRIAVVGVGKIARDQHLPAILADHRFELVATVCRHGGLKGVANHLSIEALIANQLDLEAVSLCTPPTGRHAIAKAAIEAGLHVMLEKPPAATLEEARDLVELAKAKGTSLFASWHSRAAAAVEPAREWLRPRTIRSVRIDWLENIREWHPGQDWILEAGGFGVFDPGINALSIVSHLLPGPIRITDAQLSIPENRGAPTAAKLEGRCGVAPFEAHFDFLKQGRQQWTIAIDTDGGRVELMDGGAAWAIDGVPRGANGPGEYPLLYAQFTDLIANSVSDADVEPLRIVTDAFSRSRRIVCEPFIF